MTFAHVIDLLTGIASLGVKFVGFPRQMRKNRAARRQGQQAGMVWELAAAMCAAYLLWVIDGLVNHDWTVVVGQGFGVLVTAPLVVQAVMCDRRMRRLVPTSSPARVSRRQPR